MKHKLIQILPGLATISFLAVVVMLISNQYGGPVMLYALLFGIAFNRLASLDRFSYGIAFAAKRVLRFGVALLGIRITLGEVAALGSPTIAWVLATVAVTIGLGWVGARWLGLKSDFAMLSAGAVAICGASAALAIAAVLPQHEKTERNTLFVIVGVTTLSTIAMLVYPLISQWLHFSDLQAGVFLGGTIHDVAQVVGAGYLISDQAGETAALVKLMRVACLVPVVMLISLAWRGAANIQPEQPRPALLPVFLVVFVILLILNSVVALPALLTDTASDLSRWCLVIAVTALGARTSPEQLLSLGMRPATAMIVQSLIAMVFVLAGLLFVLQLPEL